MFAADMSFSDKLAPMRVNDHHLTGPAASEAARAQETQRADRAAGRSPTSGAGGDRVELSSTVDTVSRALAAHQSDRAARVQELTALYQSGRYQPDAAATSRAMVADALASAIGSG